MKAQYLSILILAFTGFIMIQFFITLFSTTNTQENSQVLGEHSEVVTIFYHRFYLSN
jgi:hypothetical protein